MIEVTQDFNACRTTIKASKYLYYIGLWVLLFILYTPEILNINIEQEAQNMSHMGHDNVLIHVIEHDIVATLDILYGHKKTGKWSDELNI